ncbi:hypothetical protein TREMEDRAFT_73876 [Tremella mesenterica DSM 1558]|uniref:uncharacterized protein n=1 Tax=Tremella mesenterica (strain ATCC 24925 / CBS 8224 / DSM 1558 / NBRC 9311 / NRRL Y-6157 / RJB 2259-6 / UBC 559-6) TaxID=578456 RepID=UPI0003F4A604|nr:uncharacterized protein TREMEDRAFT_73876 [Tremella mesenterica DSM 1558]EIW69486.1 hypothetical protein TREMEDRAFT_73876 [Tremella mesenterica DSM 1558]
MTSQHDYFSPLDKPRIRHITGVRIHQLTLPESLPYASKLLQDPEIPSPIEGYNLGDSSRPRLSSTASHELSRRERRVSVASRTRSESSSTICPSSPVHRTTRSYRLRAPTLAGEAIEHAQEGSWAESVLSKDTSDQVDTATQERLARCFVVLKIAEKDGGVPFPQRSHSQSDSSRPPPLRPLQGRGPSRSLSSPTARAAESRSRPSTVEPPDTPSPPLTPISSTSSFSGVGDRPAINRQSSLSIQGKNKGQPARLSNTEGKLESASPMKTKSSLPPISVSLRQSKTGRPAPRPSSSASDTKVPLPSISTPTPTTPFFFSSIHPPSTHPRFLSLTPETDFASWLTVQEMASSELVVEIWVEDSFVPSVETLKWRKLENVGGRVQLDDLRIVTDDTVRPPNTLEFTLSIFPKSVFYLPLGGSHHVTGTKNADSMRSMLQRSVRELRRKQSLGVGGLHQLVNLQAVIADTEREIAQVQRKINALLLADTDNSALRREVEERSGRIRWLKKAIMEVEKSTMEAQSRVSLEQEEMERRRENLARAEEADEIRRSGMEELHSEVKSIQQETQALRPAIHLLRSQHVQTLDSLFPIVPLNPSTLLYSILEVPLPIPSSPEEPAPPLTMPTGVLPDGMKIDERTTSAALGYVAMVVHLLDQLKGTEGGLPYPVTCAGSRSLVKDAVSVMQGPRSFPLYARGVERYRFEYAVYLLNKNIEMLMQEADIRLVELRHTLPNLKNLLLTLSSPEPPPLPIPMIASSSRQTSLFVEGCQHTFSLGKKDKSTSEEREA